VTLNHFPCSILLQLFVLFKICKFVNPSRVAPAEEGLCLTVLLFCLFYRGDKDAFVSSLFQPKRSQPTGPLVEDLDAPAPLSNEKCDSSAPPNPPPEEKSMLELMMEEQKAAKAAKEKLQEKERAKMSKEIGSGFKKGFFGGSKATKKESSATTTATKNTASKKDKEELITLSKPKANANIVNNSGGSKTKENPGLVMDEVQEAMKADDNPMMQGLKKGGVSTLSTVCRHVCWHVF
jgi:hypothetical protein